MRPSKTSTGTFTWRGVQSRITVERNHRIEGWTLITLRVTHPNGAPLPFALTGTLSHGIEEDHLRAAGGPVHFLTLWANREANNPGYLSALAKWRQGDLFR